MLLGRGSSPAQGPLLQGGGHGFLHSSKTVTLSLHIKGLFYNASFLRC